jgi:hypothetical protein
MHRHVGLSIAVVLTAIILIIIPACAHSEGVFQFVNMHDEKVVYILFWMTHPFDSHRPANIAAGELKKYQVNKLGSMYPAGLWCVMWKIKDPSGEEISISYCFITFKNDTEVILTPYNVCFVGNNSPI